MDIKTNIRNLRITAFFLFLIPTISLVGSLVAHNFLVSFTYDYEHDYKLESNLPGTVTPKFECIQENNYCYGIPKRTNKLDKCNIYYVDQYVLSQTGEILTVYGYGSDYDQDLQQIEVSGWFYFLK